MGWKEDREAAFAEGQAKFLETLEANSGDNCPYKEVSDERSSWLDGYNKAVDSFTKNKVKDFLTELQELCKKHNVEVSSGCGCCGAGGRITVNGKEYEFSF